jgi:hypothetical protein
MANLLSIRRSFHYITKSAVHVLSLPHSVSAFGREERDDAISDFRALRDKNPTAEAAQVGGLLVPNRAALNQSTSRSFAQRCVADVVPQPL